MSKVLKRFSVKVQPFKLSELVSTDWNPRVSIRDDDQLYQNLHRSISKLGYIDPIIVNTKNGKNSIVAGNQRYQILCDLAKNDGIKLEDTEVDAVVVDYSDDVEVAANIAHNNIHGDWLTIKLREELENLKSVSDDLVELTGFDEDQLLEMLATEDVNDGEDQGSDDFCLKLYLPQEYQSLFDFYCSLNSEEDFKKEVMKILTGAKNDKQ